MTDLMVTQQSRVLSADVDALSALANRLMIFPPGKPLTKPQAAQMAAYSFILDADPYNDEIMVTDIGIQKGIPLYRRKAKEWNLQVHGREYGYTVSYRKAKEGEADFDPTRGDVAYVATVIDEYQLERWQNTYSTFLKDAIAAGAKYDQAREDAFIIAGPRPEHTGIGVVDAREKFSKAEYVDGKPTGDYKPEMYDRHERAKKRGLKIALKDAYPSMMAALDMNNNAEEIARIVSVVEKRIDQYLTERSTVPEDFDEKKAIADLGYDVTEPDPPPPFVDVEYEDVDDPLWTEPEDTDPNKIYWDVADSKGTPYREKELSSLSYSLNALNKKIKTYAYEADKMDETKLKEYDDLKLKRDAVHYWINLKKEQEHG